MSTQQRSIKSSHSATFTCTAPSLPSGNPPLPQNAQNTYPSPLKHPPTCNAHVFATIGKKALATATSVVLEEESSRIALVYRGLNSPRESRGMDNDSQTFSFTYSSRSKTARRLSTLSLRVAPTIIAHHRRKEARAELKRIYATVRSLLRSETGTSRVHIRRFTFVAPAAFPMTAS